MRDLEDEKRIRAYMEAKMTHIKVYNECMNLADGLDVAKFAELVRADEREKVAQWMIKQGFATGHGDSIEDLLKELDEQIGRRIVRQRNNCGKAMLKAVADEREACARVCEEYNKRQCYNDEDMAVANECAAAIRARGEK